MAARSLSTHPGFQHRLLAARGAPILLCSAVLLCVLVLSLPSWLRVLSKPTDIADSAEPSEPRQHEARLAKAVAAIATTSKADVADPKNLSTSASPMTEQSSGAPGDAEQGSRPVFDAARIARMEAANQHLLGSETATRWMLEHGYDPLDQKALYEQYSSAELQSLADNDDLLAIQELGWRAAGKQDLNQARRWHLTAAARGSTQALTYLATHEYSVSFNMQKELRPEQWRKTQAWFLVMSERKDPLAEHLPLYLSELPWPIPAQDLAPVQQLAAKFRLQLQQIREQEGRGEFDSDTPPEEVSALADSLK